MICHGIASQFRQAAKYFNFYHP